MFITQSLQIPYTSKHFPSALGRKFQGRNICSCYWSDLLWSSITVGKAEYQHVTRYGKYSTFEVIYRAAIIYANLRQDALGGLTRSAAYDSLDPSEKSAISYFLSLTSSKLFAEKYLGVSWLMHLDVYRDRLSPRISIGKSRPDLIGMDLHGNWYVIEAKGRTGSRDQKALNKAKDQVGRLISINGVSPRMRVALISSFDQDVFSIDWVDPDGYGEEPLYLELGEREILYSYYKPIVDFLDSEQEPVEEIEFRDSVFLTTYVTEADIRMGVSRTVYRNVTDSSIEVDASNLSSEGFADLPRNVSIGQDGIYVELGPTWDTNKMILQPSMRERWFV